MRYYIADAFTKEFFGGNPAGVVYVEDYPADELMQRIAAEFRYSETVFIKQLGITEGSENPQFQLRYFTPEGEVELCGHATIAAFHTLRENGLVLPGKTYVYHAKAGALNVDVTEDAVYMDMAAPKSYGEISERAAIDELYSVMRIECRTELIPEMISTGLIDIMMPVESEAALEAIEPDMKALSELSKRYGVVGVHAFFRKSEGLVHCRNFAPLYGIDEEAATGTSNGALSYYLYKRDMTKAMLENLFVQGEKMNRPSEIRSRIFEEGIAEDGSRLLRIQVGGKAVTLAKGELLV